MSTMQWPWLAVALLQLGALLGVSQPLETTTPPTSTLQPAEAPSNRPKVRAPKLLERDRTSARTAQKTLDRGASELAWRNWLQSPESRDPAAPPRRITPKSVFIAPHNCPEGKRLGDEGCITVQTIGKEAHEQYILDQLNSMHSPGPADVVYDYEDTPSGPPVDPAAGPLQLNLPLGPAFSSPASQNMPSRLPMSPEKKDGDKKAEAAELEAELEKLKLELNKLANINESHKKNTHIVPSDQATAEKPKRDNEKANNTALVPKTDEGQKEIIFGNVAVDTFQITDVNQTQQDDSNVQVTLADSKNTTTTHEKIISLDTRNDTTDASESPATKLEVTTQEYAASTIPPITHNLKETEKPTKLHPEVDYSDIGETVKLISRYAEVTTDDTYKSEHRKHSEESSPLGTRTKQQHRKKQRPAEVAPVSEALSGLYLPGPQPSVYSDLVPARIIYPKSPSGGLEQQRFGYYRYPSAPQRYAPLPPGYPFRHVQEYWAHPELYLGPYVHSRRHHHSYQQPPRRARHPDPALYRLLGVRRWYSGDGAADR